ncbi:MAG: hypothetical protein NZO16_00215 [Deltaproteobacteria bacterium]|nr:hypothetical protein [Deltaproteobacteria bacterium]
MALCIKRTITHSRMPPLQDRTTNPDKSTVSVTACRKKPTIKVVDGLRRLTDLALATLMGMVCRTRNNTFSFGNIWKKEAEMILTASGEKYPDLVDALYHQASSRINQPAPLVNGVNAIIRARILFPVYAGSMAVLLGAFASSALGSYLLVLLGLTLVGGAFWGALYFLAPDLAKSNIVKSVAGIILLPAAFVIDKIYEPFIKRSVDVLDYVGRILQFEKSQQQGAQFQSELQTDYLCLTTPQNVQRYTGVNTKGRGSGSILTSVAVGMIAKYGAAIRFILEWTRKEDLLEIFNTFLTSGVLASEFTDSFREAQEHIYVTDRITPDVERSVSDFCDKVVEFENRVNDWLNNSPLARTPEHLLIVNRLIQEIRNRRTAIQQALNQSGDTYQSPFTIWRLRPVRSLARRFHRFLANRELANPNDMLLDDLTELYARVSSLVATFERDLNPYNRTLNGQQVDLTGYVYSVGTQGAHYPVSPRELAVNFVRMLQRSNDYKWSKYNFWPRVSFVLKSLLRGKLNLSHRNAILSVEDANQNFSRAGATDVNRLSLDEILLNLIEKYVVMMHKIEEDRGNSPMGDDAKAAVEDFVNYFNQVTFVGEVTKDQQKTEFKRISDLARAHAYESLGYGSTVITWLVLDLPSNIKGFVKGLWPWTGQFLR